MKNGDVVGVDQERYYLFRFTFHRILAQEKDDVSCAPHDGQAIASSSYLPVMRTGILGLLF
jgi:hypothetical protein